MSRHSALIVGGLLCLLTAARLAIKYVEPQPATVSINMTHLDPHLPVEVKLVEVKDVAVLPSSIRNSFDGGMANPGADFREGDVVFDQGLPHRRLVVAGSSSNLRLVHYEQGGRVHNFIIIIFEIHDGKASPRFVTTTKHLASLSAIKRAVDTGGLGANELGRIFW